jgi:hypothetical protein
MTKTAVGVTVTVQYYGEKSLNFNFPCVDEAVELIEIALKEDYNVSIKTHYEYGEDDDNGC